MYYLGKPISDYAKSGLRVARFHIAAATHSFSAYPHGAKADQNVSLAKQYLQMLVEDDAGTGGVDEVSAAKEMLKKLETVKF